MMERPLFIPLLSLILGILSGEFLAVFLPPPLLILLLLLLFLAIFFKPKPPFYIILALSFFAWGNISLEPFIHPVLAPNHIARLATGAPLNIEGVTEQRPEAKDKGSRFLLRVERIYVGGNYAPMTGRLIIYTGEGKAAVLSGDRVRFIARIQRPRNYGIPGEFDYPRFLAHKGVFASAFLQKSDDVIVVKSGVDYPIQRMMDRIAVEIGAFISANTQASEGNILRALLLGDRGYVSRDIEEVYARTGVNHILSISGFHVGVIALFMFHLLFFAAKSSESLMLCLSLRRVILLCSFPLLVFYLFLTGAAPATGRSVIMIAAYLAALFLERESDAINSLLLAAMAILLLSPAALFDISFQLSFIALWGIVILTPIFMAPFSAVGEGVCRKLLLFFMASVAATLATAIPVLYYFHRVGLTGVAANFFAVPLMGYGAVVLGFISFPFVYIFPPLAKLFIVPAAFLVKVTNIAVTCIGQIPAMNSWHPGRFEFGLAILFLTALTFVTGKRRRTSLCALLAVIFIGAAAMGREQADGSLRVTFFSVGQGESTLATLPDGKRMLIDGGGSLMEGGPDVGERLLAPALWRMGVRRIDYMVLTHPHPDHLKGLIFIASRFPVGEFWETGAPCASPDYLQLKRLLSAAGAHERSLNAATRPFNLGQVRFEPLSPVIRSTDTHADDRNDDSLVFRLVYGKYAVLFTGDAGMAVEKRLLEEKATLKSTIIKVPHHGSRYSSSPEFLRAAGAEAALISAGFNNNFGLPGKETLDRLDGLKIKVYRTDRDGTIDTLFDKSGYRVFTFAENGHFN